MIQTNEIQSHAPTQARPVAGTVAQSARMAYIDLLRGILLLLVVMTHAGITYGAMGSWTYSDPVKDEVTSILLSFINIFNQSFFMGLFFFVSGYFTPGAYDRKGVLGFWRDRLLRLAIPLVLYLLVLCKLPVYVALVAQQGLKASFWDFFTRNFWYTLDEGPTWFLFALLLFAAGYTLWRLATDRLHLHLAERISRLPRPGTRGLFALAALIGLSTFAVAQVFPVAQSFDVFGVFSLLLSYFPQYILLYVAGILAYRSGLNQKSDWLAQLDGKNLRFWSWLSLGLMIFMVILFVAGGAASGQLDLFLSGLTWQCFALVMWTGLACVAFSMTLILWLRDRVRLPDRVARIAGANNFAVYLIHPLILVPLTYGMSFLALPAIIKYVLAVSLTLAIGYVAATGLRRLPLVKNIL